MANHYPPDWDPAWYLETSVNIYNHTKENGLNGFWYSYTNAFKIKTPLIAVLPLPLYQVFGVNTLTPLITNLLFIVLLNIYFFKLSHLILKNNLKAFIACFILDTMPIVFWLSHTFFVEYFLITIIVMYLYYLLKSDYLRSTKYNIILGILGGVGILFKILFPIYVIGPTLLVLIKRFKSDKYYNPRTYFDISLILIITIIISSTWLYYNIIEISNYMYSGSFGSIASDYAIKGSFIYQLKKYYSWIINYNISFYYFILLAIALVTFSINFFINKHNIDKFNLNFLILCIAPIILFSVGTNKEVRFTAPLMIPIAIVISRYFQYDNIFKKMALIAVLIFPLYSVLYSSFHQIPGKDVYVGGFYILNKYERRLSPPKHEHWPINEIIDYINQDSNTNNHTFIAIIPSVFEFNHNNFRYFNAIKNNKHLDFGGLPTDDYSNAVKRLNEAKYIITKTGVKQDYLNKFNDKLQNMIDTKNNLYVSLKIFILPDGSYSHVYKKVF